MERPGHVVVKYQDYEGKQCQIDCDEMLATCIQHEMDHLEGILFVDHLTKLKRSMILRRLTKLKRLDETA